MVAISGIIIKLPIDWSGNKPWYQPTFSPEHGVLIVLFGALLTGASLAQALDLANLPCLPCGVLGVAGRASLNGPDQTAPQLETSLFAVVRAVWQWSDRPCNLANDSTPLSALGLRWRGDRNGG